MMIINWIGRVLGWSDGPGTPTSLTSAVGLPDVADPGVPVADTDELAAELARARRYEHPLSVVVLSARPLKDRDSSTKNGNGSHAVPADTQLPQMLALLTAVALRDVLRCSDVVCYHAAENRFVLALTESEAQGAKAAVDRIEEHFRTRLRLGVRAGLAEFPNDAYTLDELLTKAGAQVQEPERLEPILRRVGDGRAASSNGERRRVRSAARDAGLTREES